MSDIPDCIIAAAGRSSRMGAWKPGLPWGESTILETVVAQALEAGCRVIVVGGHRCRVISRMLSGTENVSVVRAARWRKGMDESVRRGLREVAGSKFFIVPGDMPLIRASDYTRLAETAGAETVLRPVRDGQPGHPVLVREEAVEAIRKSRAGIPLRETLRSLEVRTMEWDHDGVIVDLDTEETYRTKRPSDLNSANS